MRNKMSINSKGFDDMIRTLKNKTGASYAEVIKGATGSILENAARNTKKSSAKILKEAVEESLSTRFVSSIGDKIRKARDGSLIFKENGSPAGRWLRVRRSYKLGAVGAKNPAGRFFDDDTKKRINRSLGELRKLQAKIIKYKKSKLASSQGSWLEIMHKLRIPVKSTRGLGAAMKAKIGSKHSKSVSGKLIKDNGKAAIIVRSRSQSALNPKAGGIFAFQKAFNGQAKAFATAASKDLEGYVKQFATRNGFSVKK
tara:strand:+ start:463 stop:1230 length:768 start_codon:yes stop_codon:yes gene_type:complete